MVHSKQGIHRDSLLIHCYTHSIQGHPCWHAIQGWQVDKRQDLGFYYSHMTNFRILTSFTMIEFWLFQITRSSQCLPSCSNYINDGETVLTLRYCRYLSRYFKQLLTPLSVLPETDTTRWYMRQQLHIWYSNVERKEAGDSEERGE